MWDLRLRAAFARRDRHIQSTPGSTRRLGNLRRHLVSALDYAAPTTATTTVTQTWTATALTAFRRTFHQVAPVVDTDEIICSLPAQVKRTWGSYLDSHAHSSNRGSFKNLDNKLTNN